MNNLRGYKILVVADDASSRKMIEENLSGFTGLLIKIVDSKNIAEEVFPEPPDLILVDLNSPDHRIIKTIYRIREHQQLFDIPLLATSADGSAGIELFMNIDKLGPGRIEYTTKPFSSREIGNCLEEIFKKK